MKFIGKQKSHGLLCSSPSVSPSVSPSPLPSPTSVNSTFTFPPLPSNSQSSNPSVTSTPCPSTSMSTEILPPSEEEVNDFFACLARCPSTKPAIVHPYNSTFIPKSLSEDLPMCLSNLYKPEYLECDYGELLKLAHQCKISVLPEQVEMAESKTRCQSISALWYELRTGRITASKFKNASCTNEASPSISLIMAICHPEIMKFTSKATSWGCEHEKIARAEYVSLSNCRHSDFKVEDCGLFIHSDYPFIGASPDGLVKCTCCGEGVCEIKCPYCHKKDSVENAAATDRDFCLATDENDALELRHDHPYYYQGIPIWPSDQWFKFHK